MDKKYSLLGSKIWFLFLSAAIATSLITVISTVSFAAKKSATGSAGIININTADEKALESLPGVGNATAKAIIAGRPYKSIDDLKRVKGLSDKKIQALKDKVSVGEAAASTTTASEKSVSKKSSKATKKLTMGQHININSASKEDLQSLPGIGPSKAEAIIKGRPYDKPEDIMKVKGIKQKTFDKLKSYITVR